MSDEEYKLAINDRIKEVQSELSFQFNVCVATNTSNIMLRLENAYFIYDLLGSYLDLLNGEKEKPNA